MTHDRPGFGPVDVALTAGARMVDRLLHEAWREGALPPTTDERYAPSDMPAFTTDVKDAACLYGADMVGVTTLEPAWLRGSVGESGFDPARHTTVVVMAVAMDYDGILESPTLRAAAATHAGYSRMAVAATSVATFLRSLGYEAIPAGNEIARSVPLAAKAGLGEVGRAGQIITPTFGPRVRLCKVFTDAPLASDEPIIFGAAEFCLTCRECIEACPADAIPEGGPDAELGRWQMDADRCRQFWEANGTSCATCIGRCPFNKAPNHR